MTLLTFATIFLGLTCAGVLFCVIGIWHWHNASVMHKPTATDEEVALLFAPKPIEPRPEHLRDPEETDTPNPTLARFTD